MAAMGVPKKEQVVDPGGRSVQGSDLYSRVAARIVKNPQKLAHYAGSTNEDLSAKAETASQLNDFVRTKEKNR